MAAVQWRSLAFLLMTLFLSLHCLSFLLLDKFGKGESGLSEAPQTYLAGLLPIPEQEKINNHCNFNSSLAATVFSSPEFVQHYINFSSCFRNHNLRVKSYLGRQREIKVEANYTYWPPEKGLCVQAWDPEVSLVYLVLNPGSEARDRARRLWTSKVGKSSTVRFLLLQKKEEEWKKEIEAEQEIHEDIIVTNIREDEEFSHIHLVNFIYKSGTNLKVSPQR